MQAADRLILQVSSALLPTFYQMLEQGFMVTAPMGCSVKDFICHHLDVDSGYLAERIQTIFLNQKPVDNPDAALLSKGSVVALSAAMPGLAGATLRKGGRLAALRSQISCRTVGRGPSGEETPVRVKFFNRVARDLGAACFEKGVRLPRSSLKWFLDRYLSGIAADIQTVRLNGRRIEPAGLSQVLWGKEIFLKITAAAS